MYSCSSPIGLVSSKRKWQRPPNSWAIPKLSAIALGWPRWRYPFGSGGKRVTPSETLPSRTSAATISRMKSRRSGEAGVPALTRLLLVTSIRVVQLRLCPVALIVTEDAEDRIPEPARPVGRHDHVVGRVQPLALVAVGQHGDRAVVLGAGNLAAAVLAGEQPPLLVPGIAVGVVGRLAEHRRRLVGRVPAQHPVVGDVAPDQRPVVAEPDRALGPAAPG